eukprot:g1403.t1
MASNPKSSFPTIGEVVESEFNANDSSSTKRSSEENEEKSPNFATQAMYEPIYDCLCENCGQGAGVTRFLPTTIPYFGQVIVVAFTCEACGFKKNELNEAGEVQPKGRVIDVLIESKDDLNRQLIKTSSATAKIFKGSEPLNFNDKAELVSTAAAPTAVLEIPAGTQSGITTIEGVLQTTMTSLRWDADLRRKNGQADAAKQLDTFCSTLVMYLAGVECPFRFIIDDPAGNSYIENPSAPAQDKGRKVTDYVRTSQHNRAVGLNDQQDAAAENENTDSNTTEPSTENNASSSDNTKDASDTSSKSGPRDRYAEIREEDFLTRKEDRAGWIPLSTMTSKNGAVQDPNVNPIPQLGTTKEVYSLPTNCYMCRAPGSCKMCITDVPHFKEVIIMCSVCDSCGYRSVEVKSGGSISDKGVRYTLKITPDNARRDLQRDVLK